jgi:hypothetical protein
LHDEPRSLEDFNAKFNKEEWVMKVNFNINLTYIDNYEYTFDKEEQLITKLLYQRYRKRMKRLERSNHARRTNQSSRWSY